jgi:hypothetical protein
MVTRNTNDTQLTPDQIAVLTRAFASNGRSERDAAAFMVAELYEKARPFIREIATLLESPTARVRGDAIQALSYCATWEDGWAVALVVAGLADPSEGVRYMATKAIRYMDARELRSGLKHLRETQPESIYAKFEPLFLCIHRRRGGPDKERLQRYLNHKDPVARRFAVAIAGRPRLFIDPNLISLARQSADDEIKALANKAIESPTPFYAV